MASSLHKRFVLEANAPTPFPLPDVRRGPGPQYPYFSYYDPTERTIWLLPTDWHSKFTFYHELGHCFDRTHLTPETRKIAAKLVHHKGLRWWWGNWNPLTRYQQPNEENFADMYARACMGARVSRGFRKFLHAQVP